MTIRRRLQIHYWTFIRVSRSIISMTAESLDILTLLKGPSYEEVPSLNWDLACPLLKKNFLDGYVYSLWQNKIPNPWRSDLEKTWAWQRLWNQLSFDELENLDRKLTSAGFQVTALKGWAMMTDIYPDWGSRHMADIDLLVEPSHALQLHSILKDLGFAIQAPEYSWGSALHKHNFVKQSSANLGNIEIEVHERLYYQQGGELKWNVQHGPLPSIMRLEKTDHLFHLIVHLVYQHTWSSLYWLVDIVRYLQTYGEQINKGRLEFLVQKEKMRNPVAATSFVLKTYFEVLTLEDQKFSNDYRRKICENMLSWDFLTAPQSHKLNYYLLKHFHKDSWKNALTYDWEWFFGKFPRVLPKQQSLDF